MEILQLNFTWTSASIYRLTLANETSSAVPETGEGSSSLLATKLEYGIMARDNLVTLLTQSAFDPNSPVDLSVQRAAFIHLLNTYLLCQGTLIPEDLRLRCDEETQIKCARFIELEIQNFVDQNKATTAVVGQDDDPLDEDGLDDQAAGPSRNNKKSKKKSPLKSKSKAIIDQSRMKMPPSVDELRRLEEFDLLVTTYAKSIRCGMIDFQHSVVIIQHFTRFNKIFDISVELLVATLTEQISNSLDQISSVISCLIDVFKASFELYLADEEYTEDQFIRLSRLLQSVLIIRGPRMSYKARFDSSSAAKLHLDCIDWLIGKATEPELDRPSINRLGTLFKGLALLLIGIDGRSCLKIKADMERLIEERELTIPTSKSWDPYQLYLKRLISTMAKDPNIKRAARLALEKQSGAEASAGEEGVADGTSRRQAADEDDGDEGAEMRPPPTIGTKTKRKPQPRAKKGKLKARETSAETDDEGVSEETVGEGRTRKPGRGQRTRSPLSSSRVPSSSNPRGSSVVSVVIPQGPKRKRSARHPQSGDTPVPSSSHKRARLSAVVIEKSRDSSNPSGSSTRRRPPATSASLERPSDSPLDYHLSAPDNLPLRSTPLQNSPSPRPSSNLSPSGSEISLAALKRKSRTQLKN
ncbi:hypothetical protein PGTUg99_036002 [Puccinia graminis f. sp. tritici]|nr:hypothetical protein PGTUg99_036002 [Puccinia graminis f. sp. tritici]